MLEHEINYLYSIAEDAMFGVLPAHLGVTPEQQLRFMGEKLFEALVQLDDHDAVMEDNLALAEDKNFLQSIIDEQADNYQQLKAQLADTLTNSKQVNKESKTLLEQLLQK